MPDKKKPELKMLTFYRRLFLLLYLATILFTVAIEFVFVSTGKLTWSSFFLGLGGYTVAIAAIVLTSYIVVLRVIAHSERDNARLEESEERYRDLFENATDLIQSVSPDGRFRYVNRAWRQTLGYSEEEVGEITLFDVIHPDSMKHCMEMFKRVTSGEEIERVEAVFVSKAGRRVLVEGNVNCRFENGQPVATRGIFRDVTEIKEAEHQLLATRERWESAFEAVREGLFLVDRELNILQCNSAFAELAGEPKESLVGRKCYEVMHGDDEVPGFCVVGRALKEGKSASDELYEPYHSRHLLVSADPVLDEEGNIEYFIHTVMDITERKAAEKLLATQRDLAVQLSTAGDLTETLSLSIQAILDITGLDCGGVYLFDEETGVLELLYHQGLSREFVESASLYRPESPSVALVKEGMPRYVIYDEVGIQRTAPQLKEGLRAGAVLPLKDAGLVIGCVNIFSHTMEEIPEASREIMEVLIERIGQLVTRSRLYSELRESEERYRLIAENMADVIWIMDLEFNRTYTSPSIERLRGFTPEEAREMRPDEIATPESLEKALKVLAEELDIAKQGDPDPGRSRSFELEQYRKDGSTVWTWITARLLRDADGNPVGVLGVTRDITERKHDEEEIKRINDELDGFARTVSHDLRGPLTAMRLANDMLSELMEEPQTESVREEMRQTVQIVGRNIDASNRLIRDLLALARAGQVPDEISSVDVSEVVARVMNENAGTIKDRGINVTVDDELGRATAHPAHVYQVFSNLIGNAIRHNDSPNPLVKVALLETEGGNLRYLVKDNGSGIPPGDTDRIFIPFFKGKSGETGIGLATVKKIVRTNGWEIRAYNDNGACFELILKPPRTLPTPTTI